MGFSWASVSLAGEIHPSRAGVVTLPYFCGDVLSRSDSPAALTCSSKTGPSAGRSRPTPLRGVPAGQVHAQAALGAADVGEGAVAAPGEPLADRADRAGAQGGHGAGELPQPGGVGVQLGGNDPPVLVWFAAGRCAALGQVRPKPNSRALAISRMPPREPGLARSRKTSVAGVLA